MSNNGFLKTFSAEDSVCGYKQWPHLMLSPFVFDAQLVRPCQRDKILNIGNIIF